MARVRSVTGHHPIAIDTGWELASTEPGAIGAPSELDARALQWSPAQVPGTAASALRANGAWSFDTPRRFDANDWWYRTRFDAEPARAGEALALQLEGLATLADVWLNGEPLLSTDSMFHAHDIDVTQRLRASNTLEIRFASLNAALAKRRGRPRWRPRLVEATQLRTVRTSLMGRISWMPPAAPVGPWRPIVLTRRERFSVVDADLRVEADQRVRVRLRLRAHGASPSSATLHVGSYTATLTKRAGDGTIDFEGELTAHEAALWWPHTHGGQPRYEARVVVDGAVTLDLGFVAFRTIHAHTEDGGFAIAVNGVEVFCRGACWIPLDVVTLASDAASTERAVVQARDASMNMLRIPGVGIYEGDAFFDACDRLGVLVWQDFLFANMDYPGEDPVFNASVEREARELLSRTQTSASLAVLCGGSETEQAPSMLGLPPETWISPLADRLLRSVSNDVRPDVPFVTSSPTGGPLPFVANAGVTHYYGVGGYRRPVEDARRADVRFASECLAFGNIPEEATFAHILPDGARPTTHPAWKARVPRDPGSSWDAEDIRDHYLRTLFNVDPSTLRSADVDRYLELGRVATGEVIAQVIAEWRRAGSTCRGAIIWMLRDLWPGAGFGLVDALGTPKSVYWYARRAFAPLVLLATDEGVNGLALHAVNDQSAPFDGEVRVALYRDDTKVASGRVAIHVDGRSAAAVFAHQALGHFTDETYAFRFGPPGHDLIYAELIDGAGVVMGRAYHFPLGLARPRVSDVGLEATASRDGDTCELQIQTRGFAQSVVVDAPGWVPDASYFHVEPGGARTVHLRSEIASTARVPLRIVLRPLNAHLATRVVAP